MGVCPSRSHLTTCQKLCGQSPLKTLFRNWIGIRFACSLNPTKSDFGLFVFFFSFSVHLFFDSQLHFRLGATILKLLEAEAADLDHQLLFGLLVEAATGPFARGEEKSMPSMPRTHEKYVGLSAEASSLLPTHSLAGCQFGVSSSLSR